RLAAEQGDDAVERALHRERRRRLARARKPPEETGAGPGVARLRELDPGDPLPAPRDAAPSDCRVEDREAVSPHDVEFLSTLPWPVMIRALPGGPALRDHPERPEMPGAAHCRRHWRICSACSR